MIAGNNEGNPRWAAIPGSARGLSQGARAYVPEDGLVTDGCQHMQILVFLTDHDGATVAHVVKEAQRIIAQVQVPQITFLLGGGNVGVMAASNDAVKHAEVVMLVALFGSVWLFCWLTFGSLRAVLCILVPLAIVAVLCNALMAMLGIGLKVATLPVMALGVGVGVDYGIYLYERIQHEMAAGADLRQAFYQAMCQRGTAAVFTALTMAIGVCTWAFAPLKFQAIWGSCFHSCSWSMCWGRFSCCRHWPPGSIRVNPSCWPSLAAHRMRKCSNHNNKNGHGLGCALRGDGRWKMPA